MFTWRSKPEVRFAAGIALVIGGFSLMPYAHRITFHHHEAMRVVLGLLIAAGAFLAAYAIFPRGR